MMRGNGSPADRLRSVDLCVSPEWRQCLGEHIFVLCYIAFSYTTFAGRVWSYTDSRSYFRTGCHARWAGVFLLSSQGWFVRPIECKSASSYLPDVTNPHNRLYCLPLDSQSGIGPLRTRELEVKLGYYGGTAAVHGNVCRGNLPFCACLVFWLVLFTVGDE